MKENKTKLRTFATASTFSKGIIQFMHDITKDAVSTVEQMRHANDEYYAAINDLDYTPPDSEEEEE